MTADVEEPSTGPAEGRPRDEAAHEIAVQRHDRQGHGDDGDGDVDGPDGAASIAEACQAHIEACKSSRLRTKVTGAKDGRRRRALEMLSHGLYGEAKDVEEVGDDFFLDEADTDAQDLVQIEVVPSKRYAQHRRGHRLRRWKNKRGETVLLSTNGGDLEWHEPLGDDGQTIGELDSPPNELERYETQEDSPRRSVDAGNFADQLSSEMTTISPALSPQPSRTATSELFTRLPVLSEHPTRDKISTSARTSTDLSRQPTRTLTIDNPLSKPKRRETFQSAVTSKTAKSKSMYMNIQGLIMKRRVLFARGQSAQLKETEVLLAAALADVAAEEGETERVEVDVLYEHQRGLVVFGLPKFSSAALFQLDPSAWTDGQLNNTPFTRQDHPLPTPFWHWLDDEWMVDMGGDTDEHGWSYAFRFRSRHWRGVADGWRSYVRRRRWVRARVYIPDTPPKLGADERTIHIDWDELKALMKRSQEPEPEEGEVRNDGGQVANAPEGLAEQKVTPRPERASVIGLKGATSLFPVSHEHKDHVFGWEIKMDEHDPFLAWSFVRSSGGEAALEAHRASHQTSATTFNEDDLVGEWRDAVVEINYRRVARVMRMCMLDREKLVLWRWWLGEDVGDYDVSEEAVPEEEGLRDKEKRRKAANTSAHSRTKERRLIGIGTKPWQESTVRPALDNVWDLLEGRLDLILQMFEFQATRISLLRIVLAAHPISHTHYRYKGYNRDERFEIGSLSPDRVSSRLTPRLDFFNDVVAMARYYEGSMGDAVQAANKPFEDKEVGAGGDEVSRQAQKGQKRESLDIKVPRRKGV